MRKGEGERNELRRSAHRGDIAGIPSQEFVSDLFRAEGIVEVAPVDDGISGG